MLNLKSAVRLRLSFGVDSLSAIFTLGLERKELLSLSRMHSQRNYRVSFQVGRELRGTTFHGHKFLTVLNRIRTFISCRSNFEPI